MECKQPFRFTSPLLYERERAEGVSGDHTVLYECPVGYVQREAPHVYRAISAHAYAENGALNPLDAPGWLQQAFAVISSEKERLRRMADEERKGAGDAAYGQRVLRAQRG